MNPILEAFARLTMLEFAVEVLIANEMARNEPAHSQKWKRDFLQRFDDPVLGPAPSKTETEQTEAWIARRSSEMAERLLARVSERELQIRCQHRDAARPLV